MDSQIRRPRCVECGSKRFHKDSDGRVLCEDGHVLLGYVQESIEREVNTARSQRTRKTRKNKQRKEKPPSKFYKGSKAKFLQYELAQLLLRRQLYALIKELHLPIELEAIGRELWAAYIATVDIPPAPRLEKELQTLPSPPPTEEDTDEEDLLANSDAFEAAFKGQSESEEDEVDTAEETFLNTEANQADQSDRDIKAKKKRRPNELDPKKSFHAPYTLAICYLACLVLRIPVFAQDLLRLAAEYKLPYLDFADSLDSTFKSVLRPAVMQSLNPKALPPLVGSENLTLSGCINRFVKLYGECKITFPALNIVPLLWRSLFYHAAKTLLARLDVDFAYDANPSEGDRVRASRMRSLKKIQNPINTFMLPDCLIAASTIICAKLVYGLDEKERQCQDASEAISGLPSKQRWFEALGAIQSIPKFHDIEYLTSKAVEGATDDEMDAFLNFAEKHLPIGNNQPKHMAYIERQFPQSIPKNDVPLLTKDQLQQVTDGILRQLYADAKEQPIPVYESSADKKVLISGQKIPLYSKNEHDVQFPDDYANILKILGKQIGTSIEVLNKVVKEMESRLKTKSFEEGWDMNQNFEWNFSDEDSEETPTTPAIEVSE